MKIISLPLELVIRMVDLLQDIAKMKPGFEIYETSIGLTKDLLTEIKEQQKLTKQ